MSISLFDDNQCIRASFNELLEALSVSIKPCAFESKTRLVGVGASKILEVDTSRRFLLIQNKHASNTVRVAVDEIQAAVTEVQTIQFSDIPDGGAFKIQWNGVKTAAIASTDVAAAVQVALRDVTGLASVTVAGDFDDGFVVTMTTARPMAVDGSLAVLAVTDNTLVLGEDAVTTTVTVTTASKLENGYVIAAGGQLLFPGGPTNAICAIASAESLIEIIEG